jgi:hypothetical protein
MLGQLSGRDHHWGVVRQDACLTLCCCHGQQWQRQRQRGRERDPQADDHLPQAHHIA